MTPKNKNGWLPAIDAINLLGDRIAGGDKAAKRIILERLKNASLTATADWISFGYYAANPRPVKPTVSMRNYGTGWALEISEPKENGLLYIDDAFWNFSINWVEDKNKWDWDNGTFVVNRSNAFGDLEQRGFQPIPNWPICRIAGGVKFSELDILRLINDHSPNLKALIVKKPRKARNTKWQWATVINELRALHESGNWSEKFGHHQEYGAQAGVEQHVCDTLNKIHGDEPTISLVRIRVKKLLDELFPTQPNAKGQ